MENEQAPTASNLEGRLHIYVNTVVFGLLKTSSFHVDCGALILPRKEECTNTSTNIKSTK